jgi:N-acetylglutamate synthase-like GNAT family acetyltransferase
MKPYVKPEVKKVEVDSQIIRMFSKQGFIEVFWEEMKERRKSDCNVCAKTVFDDLNQKFYEVFQEFRYSSYDSFRQRLNK